MAMKVKAVEKLLKFDKNSAGVYRYVMSPEMYSSLNQKKGDQGLGYRRPQRGTARTGYHALRSALEVCGGREQGEDRSDYQPSHHLHSRHRPEGRTEEHRHRHHLLRPRR